MRGYFGIGSEGISKEMNIGSLARSAHAFGASFFFTVGSPVDITVMRGSDTSDAFDHLPYFQYPDMGSLALPRDCQIVAVELTDDAIDLPSFRHPMRAAYILGPEMGDVSEEMMGIADHTIKIPLKFCVNVGVAGALVMYDRMISMGRFEDRPVRAGGPPPRMEPVIKRVHRRRSRSSEN